MYMQACIDLEMTYQAPSKAKSGNTEDDRQGSRDVALVVGSDAEPHEGSDDGASDESTSTSTSGAGGSTKRYVYIGCHRSAGARPDLF